MDKWICYYNYNSCMRFQVGRIPDGVIENVDDYFVASLISDYYSYKALFGKEEDNYILIKRGGSKERKMQFIFAMILEAETDGEAIKEFAETMVSKVKESNNDRTEGMSTQSS